VNADNSLTVASPDGWGYAGIDTNSQPMESLVSGGTITIACSCLYSGGSCSPYYTSSGKTGCKSNPCGSCYSKVNYTSSVASIEISEGGFINPTIPPKILTINDDLPASFAAMYFSPTVQKVIATFLTSIFGQSPIQYATVDGDVAYAPDGCSFAVVNICGRATPLVVPNTAVQAGLAVGTKASCKCTSGTCSLSSKGGGFSCGGNCTGTCTLTVKGVSNAFSLEYESFKV